MLLCLVLKWMLSNTIMIAEDYKYDPFVKRNISFALKCDDVVR